MVCGSEEGVPPWSGEKGPGQNGEAVITGDALLTTAGKGSSLGQSRGFVGTNPGLVIRRLANPACVLVVALTPCLLAKAILQETDISLQGWGGRKGPWCSPVVTAAPVELREPAGGLRRQCTGVCGEGRFNNIAL